MSLMEIEADFRPGAKPLDARGAECDGKSREFMNSGDDFGSEGAKVGESETRRGRAIEFADGPFRFVGDFPSEESGVGAKFAEEGDEDVLEEGGAAGSGVKDVFGGMGRPSAIVFLEPEEVEEGEAETQSARRSDLKGGGDVGEEKVVGAKRDVAVGEKAAAAVGEEEPANDGGAGGLDGGEFPIEEGEPIGEADAGVAGSIATEVTAIVEPGKIDAEMKRGVGRRQHGKRIREN